MKSSPNNIFDLRVYKTLKFLILLEFEISGKRFIYENVV